MTADSNRPGARKPWFTALALIIVFGAAGQWWVRHHETRVGDRVAALARPGDIRMLSSDTCSVCMSARSWMTAHQVPFTECSIERDRACQADFSASLSPGTPVLLVRGRTLVGFSADRVLEALRGEG